jgi:hypothetical protein
MDVWFDSGSSWAGVLAGLEPSSSGRPGVRYPADLYLEGSDQHRGEQPRRRGAQLREAALGPVRVSSSPHTRAALLACWPLHPQAGSRAAC